MFVKILSLVVIQMVISATVGDYVTDDDYVDAVLDMLLNGDSGEFEETGDGGDGNEPVLTGGIWKCGSCDTVDDSKLIYSEVNDVDTAMMTDESVDIQIGISLSDMRCVTVTSSTPGVVRRVAGACSGDTVTLSVAPAQHFTVRVYN